MTESSSLAQIAQEVSLCTRCRLHSSRKNAVPGEGPPDAQIMFIGEGPGFHENEQGRPFVGAAGKLLEELLAGIGFRRDQVFICNVVKCRPPGNRDPLPDEMDSCREYLDRQIAAVNPQVIVTLGRFSMARYFGEAKISAVHGQVRQVDGRVVVAMFHPAAALHQPSLRATVVEDFAKLPELIRASQQAATAPPPAAAEPPKQLSLF
ncbi:MAG: uracil-DNA glycosylase [Chloroflexi bacterium RBG_16_64_43]|nr:MAG: uracil-DNA glycosylase [Chloroflexi bacterium RBG_16_64_43]